MSLSRLFYEPTYSFADFDRLFDEAFNARELSRPTGEVARIEKALKPRMDLHEDQTSNLVTATFELPGLTKEDVHIDVLNDVLTISGEVKKSENYTQDGWAVRERRFGKFSRSIQLPQGVKEGEIKANLENGILNVTFPKTTPEQAPKKITVA